MTKLQHRSTFTDTKLTETKLLFGCIYLLGSLRPTLRIQPTRRLWKSSAGEENINMSDTFVLKSVNTH